jgi:hypothetical protein
MANFTDPIKIAFGHYLRGFHSQLIADTRATVEFASRDFSKAAVWAPGRMIDQVEDMLASWRKNDTSQAARPNTALPIIIACMAKDFVPAPPEFGRGLGDAVDVILPDDPKERTFRMRAVVADIRTQIAIVAADDATARSIAMQLHTYTSAIGNRVFHASYRLAGMDDLWPVMLENPDLMAMASPSDVKNLTMLVLDIPLRATVPLLTVPKSTEPNDGLGGTSGGAGNTDNPLAPDYDPNGYLVVVQAIGKNYPPRIGAPVMGEWSVGEAP